MVHGPLSTHVRDSEARKHVPLTVDALLTRAEFVPASPRDLGLEMKTGDRLMIREIGFFAVRVYLPHRTRKPLVWMGLRGDRDIVWKAPNRHADNYAAALDAFKLVNSVTFSRVGGD